VKNNLIYFLLIFCPISNLFDLVFPLTILGYSFWNTFLIIFIIHLLIFFSNINKNDYIILFCFCFLYLIISLFRMYFFEENFSRIFSNWWYLYISLLFLIVIKNSSPSKIFFSNILLGQILFLGLIGSLFLFGLPTIEIQSANTKEFFSDSFHRYEGIYSGSNVYSSILVTYFIMFFSIEKKKLIYWLILTPIVLFAIIASASRLPIILFLLFISYSFYKKIRYLIIPLLLYSIYLLRDLLVMDIDFRLFTTGLDDQSRIEKTILFLNLFKSNFFEVLTFGIPSYLLYKDNIVISDNSFTLIILNSGLFLFIFWIFSIKTISSNFFKLFYENKIFFISVLLIFSLNNAILYLPWVLYVLFYIHHKILFKT